MFRVTVVAPAKKCAAMLPFIKTPAEVFFVLSIPEDNRSVAELYEALLETASSPGTMTS